MTKPSIALYSTLQKTFNVLVLPLILFFSMSADARWATIDDAALEYKSFSNNVKINSDGTHEETIEMRVKILKEQGRSEFANFTFQYNGGNAKVTILEAKTIYQGQEYNVGPELIEDKPLASSPQGFDQLKQILISFPKTELGAEIYLKYNYKESKPVLDNFFCGKFSFGKGGYWQSDSLTLNSEIPLYIKVNDPKNVLEAKEKSGKPLKPVKQATFNLVKPICNEVVDEPGIINNKHLTWVSVSTIDDWTELAKKLSYDYERVIAQPLPKIFESIAEKASKEKSEVDQINIVTSLLNEKVQYMGDWRSIKGKFFPRDLEQIATSQIGDCKDFSASTAAILKHLGFKAQAALVRRSTSDLTDEAGLPSIGNFNHAFLKVTGKTGKVYWIDPTNMVSMAQGIFPDIADKMVLILDSKAPSYERNGKTDPKHSERIYVRELDIVDDRITSNGYVTYKGEQALDWTGAKLYHSDQTIRDVMFNKLSRSDLEEHNKIDLIIPDLTSRIVQDVTFKFKYTQDNALIKTNLGKAILIKADWVDNVTTSVPNQISDLIIGAPTSIYKRTIIKDKKVPQIKNLDYQEDTPWFMVKRTCKHVDNNTEIEDITIFKKSIISSEELQSPEYKKLKQNLIQNFRDSAIVFN
jgi:hypothetical protein